MAFGNASETGETTAGGTITVTSTSVAATVTVAAGEVTQGVEKSEMESENRELVIGLTAGLGLLVLIGTMGGFWAGLRRGQGKAVQHAHLGKNWIAMKSPVLRSPPPSFESQMTQFRYDENQGGGGVRQNYPSVPDPYL